MGGKGSKSGKRVEEAKNEAPAREEHAETGSAAAPEQVTSELQQTGRAQELEAAACGGADMEDYVEAVVAKASAFGDNE